MGTYKAKNDQIRVTLRGIIMYKFGKSRIIASNMNSSRQILLPSDFVFKYSNIQIFEIARELPSPSPL